MGPQVGVEATNHNQTINVVGFQGAPNAVKLLNSGVVTVSTQGRAAFTYPAFDVGPRQLLYGAIKQTRETTFNTQHGQPVVNTQTHRSAGGSVHAGSQATSVQNSYALVLHRGGLVVRALHRRGGHVFKDLQHLREGSATGLYSRLIVAVLNVGGHSAGVFHRLH